MYLSDEQWTELKDTEQLNAVIEIDPHVLERNGHSMAPGSTIACTLDHVTIPLFCTVLESRRSNASDWIWTVTVQVRHLK